MRSRAEPEVTLRSFAYRRQFAPHPRAARDRRLSGKQTRSCPSRRTVVSPLAADDRLSKFMPPASSRRRCRIRGDAITRMRMDEVYTKPSFTHPRFNMRRSNCRRSKASIRQTGASHIVPTHSHATTPASDNPPCFTACLTLMT